MSRCIRYAVEILKLEVVLGYGSRKLVKIPSLGWKILFWFVFMENWKIFWNTEDLRSFDGSLSLLQVGAISRAGLYSVREHA